MLETKLVVEGLADKISLSDTSSSVDKNIRIISGNVEIY